MLKKLSFIIMALLLTLTFTTGSFLATTNVAYADNKAESENPLLSESFEQVSKGGNGSGQLEEAKKKVNGMSQDVIDICATVAMTILIVSCIFTAVKFAGAGDNAPKKNALKAAVALQVAGIVYLANVISFINFSLGNLKIF